MDNEKMGNMTNMRNEAVCMDIRKFAELVSAAVSEELGESCCEYSIRM